MTTTDLVEVARNGARLDQRVERLDERLDVGRVRLVPGRIAGADDLLGRLADGGDVDEDRPRGRADPVDELLVVVVRGQRGAGRRVEDVLDEAGTRPDDDDLVRDRVRDLDVAGRQREHLHIRAGRAGQLADVAQVDDRDLRPVVVLVRDRDALLGAGEREEAAERGEQLLGILRIGRRHDQAAFRRAVDEVDDGRAVAHPADSRILAADQAETLVDLVDHRLERRLGAVVVERLLQVLAQVVGGCRDDRRRRDVLGDLGRPVLGRADQPSPASGGSPP